MFKLLKRFFFALPIVAIVFGVFVPRVFAAGELPADPTSLDQWLTYLVGGGSAIVTTMLLSFLAERWPVWKTIDSTLKFIISIVVSGGLGLGAWAIITYVPAESIIALKAPFAALMLSVSPIVFGQMFHNSSKAAEAAKADELE